MARKKILWLCSWYPAKTQPFNGDFIQRHAQAAAIYNDIYVIHVTGDSSGMIAGKKEEITKQEGLTEHIIYYPRSRSLIGKLVAHYRWLFYTKEAIRKYISQYGKPDLAHVQVPMKMGIPGIWLNRRYGIPYLLTEHWGIYNEVEKLNYQGRSTAFRKHTKAIFDQAAGFTSVSKYLAEGINKLVTKKEYQVIPNVVNERMFFYEQEKKNAVSFRFIHVSNMVGLKNAEGILRAFKLFLQSERDAELVMVGDTDSSIREYATDLGLDRDVRFKGEVPYTQVALEMQAADCLVLFSNIENSPCVIGEALCCGLPVIATRVGGIPELVDESNGVLVEPQHEAMLATTMSFVKNNYPRFDRKKIAEEARNKFSYHLVGKELDNIYAGIMINQDFNLRKS